MRHVGIVATCLVSFVFVFVAACEDGTQSSLSETSEVNHTMEALVHPSLSPPLEAEFPDMGPSEPVSVCGEVEDNECGECAEGFLCVSAFCGGEVCVPGHPCVDDVDCPSGACIRPEGAPPSERGTCTSSDSCAETRDCALGFQCESGSCVDRRIPCGFDSVACPRGSICSFMPVDGRPYCVPAQTPCDNDGFCEPGAHCLDVDGDGQAECSPAGRCTHNGDCPAGFSCGVDPETSQAACVVDGACRNGECPGGLSCLDTGSGRARCARVGECALDSDCPPRFVCGAIHATDALRCLSFDERGESDEP